MDINSFFNILLTDKPSLEIKAHEKEIFEMIPKLKLCKNFDQHNVWHVYDVYEHILHVVDGVDNDLALRISALFHDIGKPISYVEDKNKVGHFYYHWIVSVSIFEDFVKTYNLDKALVDEVKKLVYFHDINVDKLDNLRLNEFYESFNTEELIHKLFNLKRSDLKAQNPKFIYYLEKYDIQENEMIEGLRNKNNLQM